MKLYFASGNAHKKEEMSRLLGGYELTLPKEEGYSFDPEESADDYIGNAIIKARALYDIVKAPVLADDSGLEVDALGGAPGIHTARYGCTAERHLTSVEQYTLLLENLKGVSDRSARFVCSLVLFLSPKRLYIIQETCEGSIALEPYGNGGFGYDPVFIVRDAGESAAALTPEGKDLYSHRGKAARKMKVLLEELTK